MFARRGVERLPRLELGGLSPPLLSQGVVKGRFVEHVSFKEGVLGSSPSALTILPQNGTFEIGF